MNTEEKIQKIINENGNELHVRIASFLRKNGWEVIISSYFSDFLTGKAREIDIVAVKKYRIGRNPRYTGEDCFSIRLFIECKYVPDVILLWFDEKDTLLAKSLAMDNSVMCGQDDSNLEDSSSSPRKIHHYLASRDVLKLWGKNTNTDVLYDGMNGVLNALIFSTEHQMSEHSSVVDFPIILVDSFKNLVRRDYDVQSGYREINEAFQMEINYSFPNRDGKYRSKYFLIDVVSEGGLSAFLQSMEDNEHCLFKYVLLDKIRLSSTPLYEGD